MEFHACCSRLTDFELCDAIVCELEDMHGHSPVPTAMPREHAVVHMVWSYGGFMDCNGFVYGLTRMEHGRDDLTFLAEAFRCIDMPRMSDLFRAVAVQLPYHALPTDDTDEIRHQLAGSTLGDHEALEKLYFRETGQTQAHMATYVRRRIDAYAMLDLAKYVRPKPAE